MDLAAGAVPADGEGSSKALAIGATVITLALGIFTAIWMKSGKKNDDIFAAWPADPEPEEDDDKEPEHVDVPPEYFPEGGIFTAETLAPLDGKTLPLCVGVCGKVVNCSTSGSIRHGVGYGKLWAGRDATWALATLSLKPEDASKRDFKPEDFTAEQKEALAGWYKHFTTKYKVIGTMKEYDGWDFSEIAELAKEQTPFGAKKDSEKEADAAEAGSSAAPGPVAGRGDQVPEVPDAAASSTEAAAAAKAAPTVIPADAPRFSKGDRVQLRDLAASPELNGQFGILEDFNAQKGRFVIRLESTGNQMLFKPANLLVVTK